MTKKMIVYVDDILIAGEDQGLLPDKMLPLPTNWR